MNGSQKSRIDGGTLAFILAGFIGFGAGAYLSATGSREAGIVLMAAGLAFQVMSLVRLRRARKLPSQTEEPS